MDYPLKAFGTVFGVLIMFSSNASALGVGVSTGCRIGGNLGEVSIAIDPCVPFQGFAVDRGVFNFGEQIFGAFPEAQTKFEIDNAWRQNQDIVPSRPVVYATYGARGNFGTVGVRTGAAAAGTLTANGYASASAYAQVYFLDTIHLRSTSLALGTYVDVNFDYKLHGRTGSAFDNQTTNNTYSRLNGSIGLQDTFGRVPLSESFCAATDVGGDCLLIGQANSSPFQFTAHGVIRLQIGVEYSFTSSLTAMSVAEFNLRSGSIDPVPFLYGGSSRMDAFNTLNSFLTSTSGDYEISSGSGHIYSLAPIPEPATYTLMLAGLIGIAVVRARNLA